MRSRRSVAPGPRPDHLGQFARQDLSDAGELQSYLRTAHREPGAPEHRSRSRDHGQGIPRGRAATHRRNTGPHPAAGLRRAEGTGIPPAHGLGTHIRPAEVAGTHRFPLCPVPGKAIGHSRAGRGRQPDRHPLGGWRVARTLLSAQTSQVLLLFPPSCPLKYLFLKDLAGNSRKNRPEIRANLLIYKYFTISPYSSMTWQNTNAKYLIPKDPTRRGPTQTLRGRA